MEKYKTENTSIHIKNDPGADNKIIDELSMKLNYIENDRINKNEYDVDLVNLLTKKQKKILRYLLSGLSLRDIERDTGISEQLLSFYMRSIKSRLEKGLIKKVSRYAK